MFPVGLMKLPRTSGKKQNTLYIYFNIIFQYYFSDICLHFALYFPVGNLPMEQCFYACPGALNYLFLTAVLHISEAQESLTSLNLLFGALVSASVSHMVHLSTRLAYSLSGENDRRKRGKLPPHHQQM